jgi:hypothetical protein
MKLIGIVAALLLLLVAIDRVLLWCEMRGWIVWRRTPRIRHSAGIALLNIDALLQPSRRHVIELRQDAEVCREEDDEAGPPDSTGRERPGVDSRHQ